MISHLITSKARRKLLRYFIVTGERTHLQDLVRKLDLDPKQVHRETMALWELDFISYEIERNKKYFILNERHPLVRDLKTIFRKEDELLHSFSPVYCGPPLLIDKLNLLEKFNFVLQDLYSGLEINSLFLEQNSRELTVSLNYPDLLCFRKRLTECLEKPHLLLRLQKIIQSCLAATSGSAKQIDKQEELLLQFLAAFITFHQLILAPHFSNQVVVEVDEESRSHLNDFKESVLSLLSNWPSTSYPSLQLLVVEGSLSDHYEKLSLEDRSLQYRRLKKARGAKEKTPIEQLYVCQ